MGSDSISRVGIRIEFRAVGFARTAMIYINMDQRIAVEKLLILWWPRGHSWLDLQLAQQSILTKGEEIIDITV